MIDSDVRMSLSVITQTKRFHSAAAVPPFQAESRIPERVGAEHLNTPDRVRAEFTPAGEAPPPTGGHPLLAPDLERPATRPSAIGVHLRELATADLPRGDTLLGTAMHRGVRPVNARTSRIRTSPRRRRWRATVEHQKAQREAAQIHAGHLRKAPQNGSVNTAGGDGAN